MIGQKDRISSNQPFNKDCSCALIRDDQLHDGSWCDHHDLTLHKGCGSGWRSNGSGSDPQEKTDLVPTLKKKNGSGSNPLKKGSGSSSWKKIIKIAGESQRYVDKKQDPKPTL